MDVASLVENKKNPRIPDIAPGDTVRVSARIVEGGKERIQVFQGVVIKVKTGGNGASFTVRHVAFGIGVERTFPFYSPLVEKVEIVRQGKVRRSRLYYLRGLSGKESRRKIKRVERKSRPVDEEMLVGEPEEVLAPEDVLPEETEDVEGGAPVAEVKEGAPVPEAEVEVAPEAEAGPVAEAVGEEKAETTAEAPEAVEEEKPRAVTEEEPKAEVEAEPATAESEAAPEAVEEVPTEAETEEKGTT